MRLLIELAYGLCRCRTCRVDRMEWLWLMTRTLPALSISALALPPPVRHHPEPVQACRACGCWRHDACLDAIGEPCHWVEADLCSCCRGPSGVELERPHPYAVVH